MWIPVANPPSGNQGRAYQRAGFPSCGALEPEQFVVLKAQDTGQGNDRLG